MATPERKQIGSHVDNFRVGDRMYHHEIFCSDDDRIECFYVDNRARRYLILTHTANCDVLNKDKQRIGRWTMRDHNWVFEQEGKPGLMYGRDLLKAEVEVSKLYIEGELTVKVALIESERGWGSKVDEVKEFVTKEEAEKFIKEFNSKNDSSKPTPDWYMYAQLTT